MPIRRGFASTILPTVAAGVVVRPESVSLAE